MWKVRPAQRRLARRGKEFVHWVQADLSPLRQVAVEVQFTLEVVGQKRKSLEAVVVESLLDTLTALGYNDCSTTKFAFTSSSWCVIDIMAVHGGNAIPAPRIATPPDAQKPRERRAEGS